MLNDTIAAISTALQDGAISVIRISGPDSLAIAGRLFSRRVDDQPTHTVRYGYIIDPISKEAVDEVLLTVFRAPKTFTREDVVEISGLSLIHISEPTRQAEISYAVFCLKKKKQIDKTH